MTTNIESLPPMAALFPQWAIIDGTVPVEVQAAYDAAVEGRPDAADLLVGLPATISIGSDSYAAEVARATPKTVTARYRDGEELTFRHTKRGWSSGPYRLSVGTATDHRDPSF